jgi:hypothetical protein
MSVSSIRRFVILFAVAFVAFASAPTAFAEPYFQGTKSCEECHKDEYKAWEGTKHFSSYRSAHKNKDAKKITKAVGGKKNMKGNKSCTVCHYATTQKKAEDKPKVKFGPACESCHGASSVWEPIHSDYGGKNVKREAETSDHKAKRIADSAATGLIWNSMNFEAAAKCMKCHGLARSEISGDAFAKMLEAGHPINPSFEIVMFSQGKMRHWRDKRSRAELSRLFVAGQAAKLVSATEAAAKTEDAKYKAAQTKRAADAKAVLQAVPQAATLIQSPSDDNARKMMQAIGQQDLTDQIGGLMKCAPADKENLWQCN